MEFTQRSESILWKPSTGKAGTTDTHRQQAPHRAGERWGLSLPPQPQPGDCTAVGAGKPQASAFRFGALLSTHLAAPAHLFTMLFPSEKARTDSLTPELSLHAQTTVQHVIQTCKANLATAFSRFCQMINTGRWKGHCRYNHCPALTTTPCKRVESTDLHTAFPASQECSWHYFASGWVKVLLEPLKFL